jgi:uncharacterized membrane protein YidH (DUF202 family)
LVNVAQTEKVESNNSNDISKESSSNWKLAIILISIFFSFIIGLVIYAIKGESMTPADKKTSKTVLMIIAIVDIVVIILATILLSTLAFRFKY